MAVSPDGSVSVADTAPEVGPWPTLVTVSVYCAAFCPCVNDPVCAAAIDRSGGATIAVASLAESLATFVSPPPPTTAVLLTLAGASGATVTIRVIGG